MNTSEESDRFMILEPQILAALVYSAHIYYGMDTLPPYQL